MALHTHEWGEMGKTAESCGLFKSKTSESSAEELFKHSQPKHSQKISSSHQCVAQGREASCSDWISVAICHFSSSILFSVWGHLSRQPPWSSIGGGRACEGQSSVLQTLLLEAFPPAPRCPEVPTCSRLNRTGDHKWNSSWRIQLNVTVAPFTYLAVWLFVMGPWHKPKTASELLQEIPRGFVCLWKGNISWTLGVSQMDSWPLKQRWEPLTSLSNRAGEKKMET